MLTLTEAGNLALSVEMGSLNSEAYSADAQTSYRVVSVLEHQTNILTSQQEGNP